MSFDNSIAYNLIVLLKRYIVAFVVTIILIIVLFIAYLCHCDCTEKETNCIETGYSYVMVDGNGDVSVVNLSDKELSELIDTLVSEYKSDLSD